MCRLCVRGLISLNVPVLVMRRLEVGEQFQKLMYGTGTVTAMVAMIWPFQFSSIRCMILCSPQSNLLFLSPTPFLSSLPIFSPTLLSLFLPGSLHFIPFACTQVVINRCRLSWLTNSALFFEPRCGGRGIVAGISAKMSTAVHMEPK